MIDELFQRGLITKSHSPWCSPLIILKKAPRECKLGSVMSNKEVCRIPGMKMSGWDPQAGLRLVISLKKLKQSLAQPKA